MDPYSLDHIMTTAFHIVLSDSCCQDVVISIFDPKDNLSVFDINKLINEKKKGIDFSGSLYNCSIFAMGSLLSFYCRFFCYTNYRWRLRACGPFVIKWRHII